MAIDVYLQIDDIKGESADDGHKQWIECLSATWSVRQPRSATASTGGGHTAERSEHGEVVISKLADISSPLLLQTCSTGRTIPSARLEFMRADGNGDRVKYFEIMLENVLIGGVCPSIHEGELLSEHVGLKFSKAKWKYTQQKIAGGIAGNTAGGWDLATNRIC
ncbi:type VI secretion system tube protein Hcp [Rugamonas sp. FT107W]|uniref:Type VI secretion system tube protein Hcp n=1 Tax=Duganella vulcania TaxID=2692166 RepID=A0A845HMC2_9BURK|nr:type VI secretion system tube protein Hcp [Duganella vulcania]MYN19908.1 type VI secretion system tube protein Hcp [Duganella vulcania]